MKARAIIGIIFVVASLLKLATLLGIVNISFLSRPADEPWATYFTPCLLILVGADLIYQGMRRNEK